MADGEKLPPDNLIFWESRYYGLNCGPLKATCDPRTLEHAFGDKGL